MRICNTATYKGNRFLLQLQQRICIKIDYAGNSGQGESPPKKKRKHQSSSSSSSTSSSNKSPLLLRKQQQPQKKFEEENSHQNDCQDMLGEGNSNNSYSTNGTTDLNNGFIAGGSGSHNNATSADGSSANNNMEITNGSAGGDIQMPQQQLSRSKPILDSVDQDIVRLIGQHLKLIGLDKSAETLMQESGCCLEHPAAAKFREYVLSGDWNKADHCLEELSTMIDEKIHDKQCIVEMKFLLLEQKYLEFLEEGRPIDALHVLRNELTPLQHNTPRVHQLSSYMMCTNNQELYQRTGWEGRGVKSRTRLMDRLQSFLPASVMLPPRRLRSLLIQAVELQTEHCACHDMALKTNVNNVSLLVDHDCSAESFPMQALQVLNDHSDEVWFCKFSPDGLKLATGSKDTTVIIWEVDPVKLTVRHKRTLDGHLFYVSFLTWSPDSKYLIVAGPEDCGELWIWNVEDEKLHVKLAHSSDDSLTSAAFNCDGTRFVTGGQRGQFYLCDLDGTIHDSWDGVRVCGLSFRSDNRTVLCADTHYRIRSYCFDNHTDQNILQEQCPIMTFSVNSNDRLALLNISSQGLHLWDLQDKCLVRRFQGVCQGNYTIYSCFGGINESFVASGSEDNKVYIWHIRREEPLATLTGHTRTVNCVSWNPVYPALLASASDDGTVRIWGPKTQPNDLMENSSSSSPSNNSWNLS